MKQLIFFVGLISAVLSDLLEVTPQHWHGLLADHVLGIPPKDTPEVAAAKVALQNAYSEVLAVVPVLPPEERYIPGPIYHQPSLPPQGHPFVQPVYLPHFNPTEAPTLRNRIIPAEQVPRSPLGEVPEVQAAREAHFRAYHEVAAKLPKLVETTTGHGEWYHVPAPIPGLVQVVQDTPEVARAKAEHAAAVAAVLG
ncbi:uncharacterized protein LOC125502535 [Dendroctonus ponderosae]|uniref:uncharacterized protein LOC125502535 n=1 Tax=Dendroctonus ponderosae TaxID=77166 RepID=UPI0020363B08|nr:uncharacterized protein LOC125502535 [Dendroctonus ponderosae]KAH0999245.1 hypothetical protein HUJ04_009000 [Dendroctonus ponderosae]